MPWDSASYFRGLGHAQEGQLINDMRQDRQQRRELREQEEDFSKEIYKGAARLDRRSRAWRLTFDEFADRVSKILFPGQLEVFEKIRKEAFPSGHLLDRSPKITEDEWQRLWMRSRLFQHLTAVAPAYQYPAYLDWDNSPPVDANGAVATKLKEGRIALSKELSAPPPVQTKQEQTAILVAQRIPKDVRKEHAKRDLKP